MYLKICGILVWHYNKPRNIKILGDKTLITGNKQEDERLNFATNFN